MLGILALAANLTLFVNYTNTSIDPGAGPTTYVVEVLNPGGDPAQNAVLHVPLPPRSEIVSMAVPAGWTCSSGNGEILCTNPLMRSTDAARIERDTFRFDINLPADPDGLWWYGFVTLGSDTPQQHPGPVTYQISAMVRRKFVVTTTADSGAGSLRDAIVNIGQRCADEEPQCKLAFDLPPLSRIEPLTPLPAISASNLIVAGDIYGTADRAVELSGRRLQSGSGLTFASSGTGAHYEVDGLAIGDFPDYGIAVSSDRIDLRLNGLFLGTDATGTVARPNGRGLGILGASFVYAYLQSSIVSGNRNSGIWLSGPSFLAVAQCLIGAGRDLRPLGNGRSGVYDADGELSVNLSTIAYNGDAGVGVGSGANMAAVLASRVYENGTGGIDWGLDGPDPVTSPHSAPAITDAWYDAAAKRTVVKGTIARIPGDQQRSVEIFANRTRDAAGHAEGEIYAGYVTVPYSVPYDAPYSFTATLDGDYRGELLTATFNHGPWLDSPPTTTSEFSEPFLVGGRHRTSSPSF